MRVTKSRAFEVVKNWARRAAPGQHRWGGPVDDADMVSLVDPVLMDWPQEVRKPFVGLVPDVDVWPYWTKFRRFLEVNEIPFQIYDVHRSNWLREAEKFDAIVWRPMSFPSELEECRRKLWVLEHELGKLCFPAYAEALIYEDKVLQHALLTLRGLPAIPTFVSHSEDEALAFAERVSCPMVWKIAAGSGSLGVEMVRNHRVARRSIRRVFSFEGRATAWAYLRQKDYVYMQRLERNRGWDLRVIVVGDSVLGYYRDVPDGEFRASGMGLVRYGPLPAEAMFLARRVARELGLLQVAVDMIGHPDDDCFSIIELSAFAQVDTPVELRIDGVPGTYEFDGERAFRFVPGLVWRQDLVLREVLRRGWIGAGRGR